MQLQRASMWPRSLFDVPRREWELETVDTYEQIALNRGEVECPWRSVWTMRDHVGLRWTGSRSPVVILLMILRR